MYLNNKIPTVPFPNIKDYVIKENGEKLVSAKDNGLLVDSQYYNQGIPGSYKDCYVRESVLKMLLEAEKLLPKGYKLKLFDGFRQICVQQRLWNYHRQQLKIKYPDLSDAELDLKTSFFVSRPSYDKSKPSLHNTGGAIDLTIVNDRGIELDMGTKFDAFGDKAWTNYFEINGINPTIRDNRRLLYNIMIEVGFTNLPSEWWHYDYGTKFWAYFNKTDAIYEGLLDQSLGKSFPLF